MRKFTASGLLIEMHVYCDDMGVPKTYYYRLQQEVPLEQLLACSHSSEDDAELRANYEREQSHWLAFWQETCPLPGVTNEQLRQRPLPVTFTVSGSKYKEKLYNPPLERVRNLYTDQIRLQRQE